MLKQLENYYKKNGILATSFTCSHRDECSAGCEGFTGPKSAYVARGYEKGTLPRLLFLSLDSGSGNKIDEERLPQAVRNQERKTDVLALHKHKHWFRTHELAWYILRRFKSDLRIEEAKDYFSHANSAKCCMNNPQRKKANKALFKNCKKYLKKELGILIPDILITQGSEARLAVSQSMDLQSKEVDEFASIISLNGREVFWLHTYHPNNWGAFNRHRNFNKQTGVAEGWEFYATRIFRFVKEKNA